MTLVGACDSVTTSEPYFCFFSSAERVPAVLKIRLNLIKAFLLLALLDYLTLQVPVLHGFLKPCKCCWSLFCSGFSGEAYPGGCLSSFWSKNSVFLRLRYISLSRCIHVPPNRSSFMTISLSSDLTWRFHNIRWRFCESKCMINTVLSTWKSTVLQEGHHHPPPPPPQPNQKTNPTKNPRNRRSAWSIEVSLWRTALC